jgi:hypothetical protein
MSTSGEEHDNHPILTFRRLLETSIEGSAVAERELMHRNPAAPFARNRKRRRGRRPGGRIGAGRSDGVWISELGMGGASRSSQGIVWLTVLVSGPDSDH